MGAGSVNRRQAETMKKRERLEAAISGAPVDRVAGALWRHWPGDDQRADDLAAAHIEFQRQHDWDFVKVTPSSSYCLEDWGIEDSWEGTLEGTRTYKQWVVHEPEDWMSLKPLDPNQGGLGRQLECLRLLGEAFGEEVPFIQTIFSPLAQAKNLAGRSTLIRHMRQNASQVHYALQTIAETTLRFIEEARSMGIAGIFYAVQLADYESLSEAEYKVFGCPYDQQILAATKDMWLNVLHLHGPHGMFGLMASYPVQVINWHDREAPPSLESGLKRIKGAAIGGVSRDALHAEDPSEALEQARDAYEQTGGHRWILGVGCVTLVTTPVGNIRKLRALIDEL